MKILVFGIGGIGGLVGGALANTYDDIYFYARGNTQSAIKKNGLILDSIKLGKLVVRPTLVSNNHAELGKMDVIILACKGDKLKDVCHDLTPMIKESTVIIPLLNGVLVSDILKQYLPKCILTDGTVRTFSHIEEPGHIVQDGGVCDIHFGLKSGEILPVFHEIADMLTKSGIETEVVSDITLHSWQKFAITGTMGAILCYYDGNVGFVRKQPDQEKVVPAAYDEVAKVAKASGVVLADKFIQSLIKYFYKLPDDTITSLYRDFSVGKSAKDTELYALVGYLVEKGKELQVPTPIFERAYNRFKDR